jgi:hypothetical protein
MIRFWLLENEKKKIIIDSFALVFLWLWDPVGRVLNTAYESVYGTLSLCNLKWYPLFKNSGSSS